MVFAFSTDANQPLAEGTAPLVVHARQIPRLIVARLNSEQDRRVRFFPYMGVVAGRRQFFDIDEPFDPEQLREFHGQANVQLVVDGTVSADSLRMRVHEARPGGATLLEVETAYEPSCPWPAVRHLIFELTGQLEGSPPAPSLPDWSGPMLGWFLIAKDEQLAVEAEIPCDDVRSRLRAACECLALAPDQPEFAFTLLDTCRAMASHGEQPEVVGQVLLDTVTQVQPRDLAVVAEAASIIDVCSGVVAATPLYVQVARRQPAHPDAAIKAGFGLHKLGRTQEAHELLLGAYEAGVRSPALRAQLAAAEEERGDSAARDRLLDELATEATLPVPVARIVASYLVDADRAEDALALLDRVQAAGVVHAGLWLERGRALLHLHRAEESCGALERCLAVESTADIRAEARRLLRLAGDPQLMPRISEFERAVESEDLRLAMRIARGLVKERPELAEAWLLLGVARQRASQSRRAIRALRRSIELQPDLGDAHNRLGALLVARGRDEDGYDHLCRATELMPYDASPWLHLAQACLRLGRQTEGEYALARAERLGGHESEVVHVRRMFHGESAVD